MFWAQAAVLLYETREGRAAQDDDRVILDFAGTIDGVPFEGGKG
ncbi:trigger factor domain protein [Bordetella holmesii 30539]|nr:trigger factor domain protein [Bordetella holmesii 30539]